MQPLVFTLVSVAIFSFVGLAVPMAAEGPVLSPDAAGEGSLRVEFATPTSTTQTTPYFAVEGAYPGMEPEPALVTIRNTGTLAAVFDMAVALPAPQSGPQLAEVLRVTVTSEDTGATVYRGPLAGVRFDGKDALPAGASAGYLVAIDWPDGGAGDNAYQGLELEFELRARARQAG